MPARRKAFTLLELLVVIGIIGVLTTLLILGVRSVVRSSKEKATRTHMENLKNLVAERQNSGGMQAIYNLYNPVLAPNPPPYYQNGSPLPTGVPGTPTPVIPVPTNVGPGGSDRQPLFNPTSPPIVPANELARTLMVMSMLRSVPANAKMLAQLPSDSFLTPAPIGKPVTAPLPIDGWGNPMIFVPGGGIGGIFITGSNGAPAATTITSPDGKGFWVSGGPDGNIGGYFDTNKNNNPDAGDIPYGDDNIYSFQN